MIIHNSIYRRFPEQPTVFPPVPIAAVLGGGGGCSAHPVSVNYLGGFVGRENVNNNGV